MAGKKTSAEQTKEEQKDTQVGNLLDAAFGDLGGLQKTAEEEVIEATEGVEETSKEEAPVEEIQETQSTETPLEEKETIEEEIPASPSGPPSGPPPGGPPTGPPTGPPAGPPAGPPSGPPSGPAPVETATDSPSETPASPSGPPSGPPSGGPPTGPPSGPPAGPAPVETATDSPDETPSSPSGPPSGPPPGPPSGGPPTGPPSNTPEVEEIIQEEAPEETVAEETPLEEEQIILEETPVGSVEGFSSEENQPAPDDPQMLAEQEIARLNAEVERLRQSMAGVADVIEELETPPMPPAVIEDIVIGAYIVSDFARLARQLNREQLIRATMGNIAMLHPDNLGIMIATRNRTMLPRLDERGLCAGLLGRPAPRGAPADWRIMEVILASVSLVTGGPAAVIHSHGAYTTAASCEKDLVLVQPIDGIGKEQIGKVIIVDPDEDNPDDFLRQIVEALKQGGMRCVVVRGMGAYAVGADLDQAWANAAMLEHSMRIVLLARQANLKI